MPEDRDQNRVDEKEAKLWAELDELKKGMSKLLSLFEQKNEPKKEPEKVPAPPPAPEPKKDEPKNEPGLLERIFRAIY